MESVLQGRERLKKEIDRVAEVAGYLWQNGWAERNGGNIVVNITQFIDDELRRLPAISERLQIGARLPSLRGAWFYCKGTGCRMRDLARWPMENGAIIRIADDCESYELVADRPVLPTSELPSHLAVHNRLVERGGQYTATLHTHPTELVALSHSKEMLGRDVLSRLLWSMIPETRAFCPLGLGVVPYQLPGSQALAQATLRELESYDVVLWEKHGVFAQGKDVVDAFDQVDVLQKSAKIYLSARAMGFTPEGMSTEQMDELAEEFDLPK